MSKFSETWEYPRKFNEPQLVVEQETVLEDDIYVVKEKIVARKPSEAFENFKVSDFSVNHLRAIGAVDMLQDVTKPYGQAGMDAIDDIGSSLPEE